MLAIQNKILEFGKDYCKDKSIKEVRLGLGYSCAELSDGCMGVAWTPEERACTCTQLSCAGKMAGMSAESALSMLVSRSSLERAVGLATFNAINISIQRECNDDDILNIIDIKANEHVVMVGYFAPLVPAIKNTGCKFDVAELKTDKPGVISKDDGLEALKKCDVAIITATSIINGTLDGILEALGNVREAVILGPSTPMCKEVFAKTKITRLSGSYVMNNEGVKLIISEGGGTKLLKKHLRFTTVNVV
ncbi:MAG: Rossmann-like domain-containing protein [Candidatus Ozemobacteraceae bacterium]|jgi:uncharacterized protein (DUF4213/DUF364 family)|nr:DUF364 domain-containing protein [Candidatus Riflebacteria bacterium]NLV93790.1 DUF364 domain-containing protein [Candidatus Riflebacteria bacterium]